MTNTIMLNYKIDEYSMSLGQAYIYAYRIYCQRLRNEAEEKHGVKAKHIMPMEYSEFIRRHSDAHYIKNLYIKKNEKQQDDEY